MGLKNFFYKVKFILHNKKFFESRVINSDNKILIEFNPFATSHIPLSYFSTIL